MSNIETAPGHGPQVLMQMIQGASVGMPSTIIIAEKKS